MNTLEYLDHLALLFVNGLHTEVLDEVMWQISSKWFWFPLYAFIGYLAFSSSDRKSFLFFALFILFTLALSDLVSVHLFKNIFLRYRPSHNLLLESKLHYYQQEDGTPYKGGLYGFISSHAANFSSILFGSWLFLRSKFSWLPWLFIPCGVLVCMSRVYLGVHYPSDVVVGATVGILLTFLMYKVYFSKKLQS